MSNQSVVKQTPSPRISPPKFSPLSLRPDQSLPRNHLLDEVFAAGREPAAPIFIEAQAGQGKSTLAAQIVERSGAPACWYQIEPRDNDPVYFTASFYQCLVESFDGFGSELAATMIAMHELTPNDVGPVVAQMLADLDTFLDSETCLVIDDLHFLTEPAFTGALVHLLLTQTPRHCRLILASRQPIENAIGELLADSGAPMIIDNRNLAFSKSEIADYCNTILNLAAGPDLVNRMYRLTEGWIMGLSLIGRSHRYIPDLILNDQTLTADSLSTSGVFDYLFSKIFSEIAPELHHLLLDLSLLPDPSMALAAHLGHTPSALEKLEIMVRDNVFMGYSDSLNDHIVFHHLFSKCLQQLADREISEKKLRKTLRDAASWYLSQELHEPALQCYLQGAHYPQAEEVLQTIGLSLLVDSQFITLKATLDTIPEEIIRSFPWFSFFYGVVCINTQPPSALAYFTAAREAFIVRKDEPGELLVLTQLIIYHISVDAMQYQDSPLVGRAMHLLEKYRSTLDIAFVMQAVAAIAFGCAFFKGDLEQADRYSLEALRFAESHGLMNLMAYARMIRAYRYIFSGNWDDAWRQIEACRELLLSPRVNAYYRHAIAFIQAELLEVTGQFTGFVRQKTAMENQSESKLLNKSVFGPYLNLRHIDQLIASGHPGEAKTLAETVLMNPIINGMPHLNCQFLQYLALLQALEGKPLAASETAERAMAERDKVGIASFTSYNRLIVGAAYAVMGDASKGKRCLDKAQELSGHIGETVMRAGIHAYRAFIQLKSSGPESALEDLSIALRTMRQYRYVHFYGWTPDAMQALLALAIEHDIESDYARQLAFDRLGTAILEDGSMIPLFRVETLGGFRIQIGGQAGIREQDMPQAQRHLLALLLVSTGYCLSTAQIQAALWPESDAKKGRSKLDTLVSRLRSTLTKRLPNQSVQHYLCMEKGILSLNHCHCDATAFMSLVRQGMEHTQKQEYWQADHAFYAAHQLWNGPFMPGFQTDGALSDFGTNVLKDYLDSAVQWGRLLLADAKLPEAIQVVEQALKLDDIHHGLIKLLYELHSRQNNPAGAAKLLKTYRQSLSLADFSADEIDEIVESLWAETR